MRPCIIGDRKAVFHEWGQASKVVDPSPLIGGHPGGTIQWAVGIVEYEDGSVEQVFADDIKFLGHNYFIAIKIDVNIYDIDYQYGRAKLFTPSDDWRERFYHLASQCFGIRKSIGDTQLLNKSTGVLDKGYERLEHNGDVIIWDDSGNKIESEFD